MTFDKYYVDMIIQSYDWELSNGTSIKIRKRYSLVPYYSLLSGGVQT
jgi:hypothetical protein